MDSIKKVTNVELKENKEKLLNSMRILMHTAKGVFESTPFRDKDIAVGTGCHNLVIEAGGDTYPVFYTPDTMFADGTVAITDDIYDEENYLLLSDDDDMLWLSLVMQLDTLYKDECERSNGLDEALKEANKKCTEYVKEIDKLEVDNKRLSERVKNLVIDKSGKLEKSAEEETEKPVSEIVKECVDKPDLVEKYEELQEKNRILRWSYNNLRSVFNSTYGVSVANHDDMQKTITKETFAELTERIKELETTLKDKDERINQLSKNNAALSVENKNISNLLEEADRNVRFYVREVDNLEKEIKDLQAKALSDKDDMNNTSESIKKDMEKQNKKYTHLKQMFEMIDDLMESDNEDR